MEKQEILLKKACEASLSLLCTGYENGIAKISIADAGHVISLLKNALHETNIIERIAEVGCYCLMTKKEKNSKH